MKPQEVFYDQNAKITKEEAWKKRNESKIFHMRNFNNWIKSLLLHEYLGKISPKKAVVLDYCCGKGGDIRKFLVGNTGKVYFVDISSESIDCCKERYVTTRPPKFEAEFLHADVSRTDIVEEFKINGQIDLVSCQFALHYAFQSEKECKIFFENISKALKPGGYFIATIPNAYEIVSRVKKVSTEENKLCVQNSVYSIKCKQSTFDDNFPLFGAQYIFGLYEAVDCPEYLVYPPFLEKICLEYGLEVDRKFQTFRDYAFEMYDNEDSTVRDHARFLMQKTTSTKTIYSDMKISEPYDHVTELLDRSDKVLGTLSKDELEVIDLYALVAFRKKDNLTS